MARRRPASTLQEKKEARAIKSEGCRSNKNARRNEMHVVHTVRVCCVWRGGGAPRAGLHPLHALLRQRHPLVVAVLIHNCTRQQQRKNM
jgi:hypothetical protein